MLQKELLALPHGARVNPKIVFSSESNYIHRADKVHSLRQQLIRLSKLGKFRLVGDDEWERVKFF